MIGSYSSIPASKAKLFTKKSESPKKQKSCIKQQNDENLYHPSLPMTASTTS
ncbi:hypothetical protein Hanom_Chr16g01473811 [Helianthus anomalus]